MSKINLLLALTISVSILIFGSCDEDDELCIPTSWYQDADEDGLGNPDVSISSCTQPDGYVADNTDTDDDPTNDCESDQELDTSRGACNETLGITPVYTETSSGGNRIISSNCIPEHMVGLFGMVPGSLNPNAISAQSESYTITMNPIEAGSFTALLATGTGPNGGPQYSFGVLLNWL